MSTNLQQLPFFANVKSDIKNKPRLDTLEQLSPKSEKKTHLSGCCANDLSHDKFAKRQKAKAISNAIIFNLVDHDSPLKKQYWSTYHCTKDLFQIGNKVKTKYCGKRWCTVCSRIMMAKMINGYAPAIKEFKDLQFVTLTSRNVKKDDLQNEVDTFNRVWRKIYKRLKKNGFDLKGLRKLEITISKVKEYNPHYHLIVEGQDVANEIVRLWMEYMPFAGKKGQNVTKGNEGSLIELFKYATKQIYNDIVYSKHLDTIYQSIAGRRIYQPFGIKKYVSEDVSGIKSDVITFKPYQNEVWVWDDQLRNWIDAHGETFTNQIIDGKLKDFLDKQPLAPKESIYSGANDIMNKTKNQL